MADPIHQFQIQKIVDFGAVNLPVFGRTELAITNPLKNAILGKDLGTMADVGGLKGIWARLTGRGDGSDIGLSCQ